MRSSAGVERCLCSKCRRKMESSCLREGEAEASDAGPQRASQTCDRQAPAKLPGRQGAGARPDRKGSSAATDEWPVSQANRATQPGRTGPCPGETSQLSPRGAAPGPHRRKGRGASRGEGPPTLQQQGQGHPT